MDSQVGLQVTKSRKYHWLMHFYNNSCNQLVSTCAGWPNGEKLVFKFELDQSQRKSMQVITG